MSDRFPLIVNAVSKKIEEIVAGDNLELTGNGIVISGDFGAGKYITSDGTTVFWGSPGDVYLTQTQTLTNKTIESSIISGTLNTITNLPNTALINSGININGASIPLGGTVVTPDDNTTYTISTQDGISASQKILRLTSVVMLVLVLMMISSLQLVSLQVFLQIEKHSHYFLIDLVTLLLLLVYRKMIIR